MASEAEEAWAVGVVGNDSSGRRRGGHVVRTGPLAGPLDDEELTGEVGGMGRGRVKEGGGWPVFPWK